MKKFFETPSIEVIQIISEKIASDNEGGAGQPEYGEGSDIW